MQEGEPLQDLPGVGAHDALAQLPVRGHHALQRAARHVLKEDGQRCLLLVVVGAQEVDDVRVAQPLIQGELLSRATGGREGNG